MKIIFKLVTQLLLGLILCNNLYSETSSKRPKVDIQWSWSSKEHACYYFDEFYNMDIFMDKKNELYFYDHNHQKHILDINQISPSLKIESYKQAVDDSISKRYKPNNILTYIVLCSTLLLILLILYNIIHKNNCCNRD